VAIASVFRRPVVLGSPSLSVFEHYYRQSGRSHPQNISAIDTAGWYRGAAGHPRTAQAVPSCPATVSHRVHLPWREQHVTTFALDYLSPYSPELNPIERVWKLTRRLCLHNRYFGFLETVIFAVESRFSEWTHPNDTLRPLCAIT
jgi:transposase